MLLAGLGGPSILLEDAVDLAEIMVSLRRHVPADRWVDNLVYEREQAAFDALGAA